MDGLRSLLTQDIIPSQNRWMSRSEHRTEERADNVSGCDFVVSGFDH
ncbi:MAG: hypothetical protein P8L78_01700 [Mariniblastus sp.]|nr:hypothetical protein [Mariniblastus sp.]MDG2180378.1 hypothetical protein [Mariniblastus sp.]